MPEGVGRFFQRTYRGAKTGAQRFQDVWAGRKPGETRASGQTASPLDLTTLAFKRLGQVAVNALGYDEARRMLAKQLGVDPYTTNPVLTRKLDEIAWASFSGGLGIQAVTHMIPGGKWVSRSTLISEWVWDLSPNDLRLRNEKQLQRMGIRQAAIDRFLRHHRYTLTMQTLLVEGMQRLAQAKDCPQIIAWALDAESPSQAYFIVSSVRMLARFHQHHEPIEQIAINNALVGRTQKGKQIIVAPVDYLSWTRRLHQYSTHPAYEKSPPALWLAGRISPRARKELSSMGWEIHTESLLERIQPPL